MMPRSVWHRSAPPYSGTPSTQVHYLQQNADRHKPENDQQKLERSPRVQWPDASSSLTANNSQLSLPPRVNLPAAQVPCKYFASGYCSRGTKCLYKHALEHLKLQKIQLRPVLSSVFDISQQEPRLSETYMLKGQGEQALTRWRAENWKFHIAHARAVQSERDGGESRHSKVMQDVERVLAKNDGIGDSARRVAGAKNARKVIVVNANSKGMMESWTRINPRTETDLANQIRASLCRRNLSRVQFVVKIRQSLA